MWIITHDNVHEAVSNPAVIVPKSRDYMTQATRKKAACRKHIFRLTKGGRELFRGVAYFENDAPFKEILRPLDEFGRSMYDCDGIEYLIKYRGLMPNGCNAWNPIHEAWGRALDYLVTDGTFKNIQEVLDAYHVEATHELSREDLLSIMNADRR